MNDCFWYEYINCSTNIYLLTLSKQIQLDAQNDITNESAQVFWVGSINTEAVAWGCSAKKAFLKILNYFIKILFIFNIIYFSKLKKLITFMIYNTLNTYILYLELLLRNRGSYDMIDLLIKGVVKDSIRTCVTKITCNKSILILDL